MLKWSELSARQRNELVATKVMGLEPGVIAAGDYTLEVWDGKLLPYYSTEIAAAWEVVEKMRGSLLEIRVLRAVDRDDWEGFEVTIGKARVTGKTLPEALCWAALRARSVEIEP